MLRVLRAKELDGVDVREGSAHAIPVEDRWADALVVAQVSAPPSLMIQLSVILMPGFWMEAFHWFANIQSLREFARVLRQRGSLGLIWNAEDYNQTRGFSGAAATEWETLLRELNWEYSTDPVCFPPPPLPL